MIRETLVPATGVDDDDVAGALDGLTGMGRTLVAAGVLVDEPIVLAAPPLQVEIYVSLGNDALKGRSVSARFPGLRPRANGSSTYPTQFHMEIRSQRLCPGTTRFTRERHLRQLPRLPVPNQRSW